MASREEHVYFAKLAEQAGRYDEMAEYMKAAAQSNQELSVEERNLLSVAYKNSVDSRRKSWQNIASVEQKEQKQGNTQNQELAKQCRAKVEAELKKICDEILQLIDNNLVPQSTSGECKVFYYNMKGDYYRYIAEYTEGEGKAKAANSAKDAYDDASTDLVVTHPIRLGLALKYAKFLYEVLNNQEAACKMLRQALEDATAELGTVSEDSYKDSTQAMQALRDKLTVWTGGDESEEEEEEEEEDETRWAGGDESEEEEEEETRWPGGDESEEEETRWAVA